MDTKQTKIFEIGLKADEYLTAMENIKKSIKELKAVQKDLKKIGEDDTKTFVENEVAIKELQEQYRILLKNVRALNTEQIETKDLQRIINKELNTQVKTIGEAKAQIRLLNKLKESLNVKDEQQAKLLKLVNKRIEENTNFIRENGTAEDRRVLNIGNYTSALEKLQPLLSEHLSKGLEILEALKSQKEAIGEVTGGLGGLKKALLGLGIGILIGALTLLSKLFLSTAEGMEKMKQVSAYLSGFMQVLTGRLQKMAIGLVKYLSKPKQVLNDLLDFIKGQFVNRLEGLKNIWQGVFSGDFNKVKNGLLETATGVKNVTEQIKKLGSETRDFWNEALRQGQQLYELERQLRYMRFGDDQALARLERRRKELELIYENEKISTRKRLQALREAETVAKGELKVKQNMLDAQIKELELKQKQQALSDEEKEKLDELKAERIKSETELFELQVQFLTKRQEIERQAEAEWKAQKQKHKETVKKTLEAEIELYKQKNYKILNADKILTDDLKSAKIQALRELANKEKELAELRYKNGELTETEYKARLLEIENEYQAQKTQIETQWEQYRKELKLAEFQDKIALLQAQLEAETDLTIDALNERYQKQAEIDELQRQMEIEQLQAQLDNQLITKDEYERRLEIIDIKYKNKEFKRERALFIAKMNLKKQEVELYHKGAKAIIQVGELLFGQNKALAIAMALIDTFAAAQKAYLQAYTPPAPDSPIRAAIGVASAIATGLKNVAAIRSVNKDGGGGKGAGVGGQGANIPARANVVISTPASAQPNQNNVINQNNRQPQQTIRVINVARDTYEVAQNEIQVENNANI